jgi:two-component system KDP operon response regulator KdpE
VIVLVVDDEPQILRAMRAGLSAHDFDVRTASSGAEGIALAATCAPDAIVLDLGLGDLDGTEVIRRVRGWSDVPIIVLSVRDTAGDKVDALDAGADDYLNKPFAMEELLARLRAMLRRSRRDEVPSQLTFGDLHVDLGALAVERRGEAVHLTPIELGLLREFVSYPGKLLTHRFLLEKVWGPGYGSESHYVRIYVRQLRRKLGDDATAPIYIATEPGMGYRWIHPAG